MLRVLALTVLSTIVALHSSLAQRQIRFSLPLALVDLTNSTAQPGAIGFPLSTQDVNLEVVDWAAAALPTNHVGLFELRFLQPTPVGSIFVYGVSNITYLAGTDWKELPAGDEAGRNLQFIPFPAGELVDSLRLAVPATKRQEAVGQEAQYQAVLPFLTLLPVRAVNIATRAQLGTSTNLAGIEGPPLRVEALIDGVVHAQSNFVVTAATTPVSTNGTWIQFQWKQPQAIRAVGVLRGSADPGLTRWIAEAFQGQGVPAPGSVTSGWRVMDGRGTTPGRFRAHELFVSGQSVTTSALRLRWDATQDGGAGEVIILTDLGQGPVPATPGGSANEPNARPNAQP